MAELFGWVARHPDRYPEHYPDPYPDGYPYLYLMGTQATRLPEGTGPLAVCP
jgi:hypothetical protein